MSLLKASFDTIDIGELERSYAVLREIGRGGMGAVVLARHREAGHRVAIKIASTGKLDPEALARFAREARLMARFRHANIVRLYDVQEIGEGRVGIVMEYVRGVSLARLVSERKALPFETCQRILQDLGHALAHAHANGVVHRDVKPHNVLVEEVSGRAKLSDFGIAKAANDEAEVTAVGGVLGTPAYMSPEQIDGRKIDGRSDIYSLGVVGWEMISGRRPWDGEQLYQLLFKQKNEALTSLTILRPDTPAALLLALEGAMEKNPAHRWNSVEDMVAQLGSDEPTPAMLERRQRLVSVLMRTPSASADSATVPLPRRRSPSASPAPDAGSNTLPNVNAASAAGASSLAAASSPRRRWLQAATFTVGVVAGGLLMLLVGRQFAAAPARGGAVTVSPAPTAVAPNVARRGAVVPQALVTLTDSTPARGEGRRSEAAAQPPAASGGMERQSQSSLSSVAAPPSRAAREADDSGLVTVPMERGRLRPSAATPARRAAAVALSGRARSLAYAGRTAEASRMIDSALALDARSGSAYIVRARMRIGRGEVRDAWTDIELGARTGVRWEALALTTMLNSLDLGPAEARERILPELRAALSPRRVLDAERAVALAAAVVQVGDIGTALTLLELAGTPDSRLAQLLSDPLLTPLRSSARFKAVRRRAAIIAPGVN